VKQTIILDKLPASRILRLLILGFCLVVLMIWNITWYLPQHTGAVPTHMMVFWDPAFGSVPSGWSIITTFDGKFIRGDTVANYGTTGGSGAPYTPTTSSVTVGAPSASTPAPGTGNFAASDVHTHPAPTVTVGADSNGDIPAYRSLKLIQYSSGIPNFIPAGAIVMFDTNGSIPSGFTRISAQDNKMIKIDSSVTTGGADTATNTVDVGALAATASAQTDSKSQANQIPAAATNHVHAAAASGTTSAVSTLPPYVQPQLAQANADTATISVALVAMFDGDPGVGWGVVSGTGGAYNQQFLRPAATASLTSQGSATHTPAQYTVTSGANTTASPFAAKSNGGGSGNATSAHTHQITVDFNPVSSLPPYFNVVIAQKVSFTLQNYRWYVENDANAVTDPWPSGSLDLAQNTAIPTTPVAYIAPDSVAGTQLRLRIQVLVSGQALPANSLGFKLQYKKDTDSSCITGSWTDVGSSADWSYGTNSVSDGATLSSSVLTPTSSVLQLFSKSASSGNNPNATSTGQTMEWDYLIKDNTAASDSQYSFRMVEASGNLLSLYSQCPTAVTRPQISDEMRHGEFFQNGSDQGFAWAD
jgi:hypothetical protein